MGAVLEQNLGQIRSKNGIETFIVNKVFSYFTWGISFKANNSLNLRQIYL